MEGEDSGLGEGSLLPGERQRGGLEDSDRLSVSSSSRSSVNLDIVP